MTKDKHSLDTQRHRKQLFNLDTRMSGKLDAMSRRGGAGGGASNGKGHTKCLVWPDWATFGFLGYFMPLLA